MPALASSTGGGAETELARSGEVVRHPKGRPMYSPFLRVSREAYELWAKAMSEFGLTPSSRTRIHATPAQPRDAFQDFLDRGGGKRPGYEDGEDDEILQ